MHHLPCRDMWSMPSIASPVQRLLIQWQLNHACAMAMGDAVGAGDGPTHVNLLLHISICSLCLKEEVLVRHTATLYT